MIPAMQFHRLAPGTPARYLREVASFATYYDRSPDHLMSDAMRASLHHLLVERILLVILLEETRAPPRRDSLLWTCHPHLFCHRKEQ